MLATILRTDVAVTVSIKIMDAFIEMRRFLNSNGQVFERLTNVEYKLIEHEKKFDTIFNQLQQEKNIKQKIFFEGQNYTIVELQLKI